MPMYQAGQTLAFNGGRLSEAREFPLGFYEAAVPPVCTPGRQQPARALPTSSLRRSTD